MNSGSASPAHFPAMINFFAWLLLSSLSVIVCVTSSAVCGRFNRSFTMSGFEGKLHEAPWLKRMKSATGASMPTSRKPSSTPRATSTAMTILVGFPQKKYNLCSYFDGYFAIMHRSLLCKWLFLLRYGERNHNRRRLFF